MRRGRARLASVRARRERRHECDEETESRAHRWRIPVPANARVGLLH
jgi:hypothetical protein